MLVERERFHELRLRALDALCESHLRSNDAAGALACALAAVQADALKPLGLAPSRGFDELVHDLVDR